MANSEKNTSAESVFSSKGISADISEAAKKGDKDALINSLSSEDRNKLNQVLNDKKALSDILRSPEAKALIKSLFGGKNG